MSPRVSLRTGCAMIAMALVSVFATSAGAGYPHRGWYGHDIVPFVPDATGYVTVAPTHPGPYHLRVPAHQQGLYDAHGRWSAHRVEARGYPWGWFGAKPHAWGAVQPSVHGDRVDGSFRTGP